MADVNTLVAEAWPNHVHHGLARAWLEKGTTAGWATSPMVQTGLIRVSMNPNVFGRAVDFPTAASVLRRYTADENHTLWPCEAAPTEWPTWLVRRVQGYRQITDATLLATAIQNGGSLVSLDAAILSLLPGSHRDRVRILLPT